MPTFGILLEDPETGEKVFEELQLRGDDNHSHNVARAAHAGEFMQRGFRSIAVLSVPGDEDGETGPLLARQTGRRVVRHDVVGRCLRCNAVLFRGERTVERAEGLRCFGCG